MEGQSYLLCPARSGGMETIIPVALNSKPADVLFSNALLFNSYTGEWEDTDFLCYEGRIARIGTGRAVRRIDLRHKPVIPGLIDAHVHIESSLLTPCEFSRTVLPHGVLTVVADPHEIANVAGRLGIRFMLEDAARAPIDIFFMLPSCVPATPFDESCEVLDWVRLSEFQGEKRVLGLGEMMNVPGVLAMDRDVLHKLSLYQRIDGHAPLLSGAGLDAYIAAGIDSDHESVSYTEALEKLRRGMYCYLREGSTERNITPLAAVVSRMTCHRCCFATDDRHADCLISHGSVDDCIRIAIDSGIEPEVAFRMATLSAAERFGLPDRGALSPGKLADFCIIRDTRSCVVEEVYRRGSTVNVLSAPPLLPLTYPFEAEIPRETDLSLPESGKARVIGLTPGQILTHESTIDLGITDIPGSGHDILKVIACSRYFTGRMSVGLVKGFHLSQGALASSVGHDSHNILAIGSDNSDIIEAIRLVVSTRGGISAVSGEERNSLPLPVGGLMSDREGTQVARILSSLERMATGWGSIEHPFMYLSFLSLTVIPSLRITPGGLFDTTSFSFVPLLVPAHEKYPSEERNPEE